MISRSAVRNGLWETAESPRTPEHRAKEGPEIKAWLPQELHPSSEQKRRPRSEPNDRFCTPVVALLRRRSFHWKDNCNGRTRHRPCNGTSLPGASSYPDRGLLGKPCTGAVQLEAASAPTRRRLFEYSWRGSIAVGSSKKQAKWVPEN